MDEVWIPHPQQGLWMGAKVMGTGSGERRTGPCHEATEQPT